MATPYLLTLPCMPATWPVNKHPSASSSRAPGDGISHHADGGECPGCTLASPGAAAQDGSTQSFFHTTPSGRILNRFSKDIYVIDEVLAPTILMPLNSFHNSISAFVVTIASTPLFTVVTLPLAVLYITLQVRSQRGGVVFV